MSNLEELQQKVIDAVNKLSYYELKVYEYMCRYMTPHYIDSSELDQWQATLDLAETIHTMTVALYKLDIGQLQTRRIHFASEIDQFPRWKQEECVLRVEALCNPYTGEEVPQDIAISTYVICQLPILEPIDES